MLQFHKICVILICLKPMPFAIKYNRHRYICDGSSMMEEQEYTQQTDIIDCKCIAPGAVNNCGDEIKVPSPKNAHCNENCESKNKTAGTKRALRL